MNGDEADFDFGGEETGVDAGVQKNLPPLPSPYDPVRRDSKKYYPYPSRKRSPYEEDQSKLIKGASPEVDQLYLKLLDRQMERERLVRNDPGPGAVLDGQLERLPTWSSIPGGDGPMGC